MKQFDSMARQPFLMKGFPGLESKVYPAFLTVTLKAWSITAQAKYVISAPSSETQPLPFTGSVSIPVWRISIGAFDRMTGSSG
jgi:hypothetical protein